MGGDGQNLFTCECGKSYPLATSLHNHKVYRCGKQPQFACPYCSHRTWHKGNLKVHIKNKHSDQPQVQFICTNRILSEQDSELEIISDNSISLD
ncbi:longitudinals lacking protein-like [Macrosteles quadrilineatus]|uniref:longitudinals lacking protein-like n=1 Tax=Macrosteles quadrilineatus TaxID=74068 RepID=UPI0023E2B859|nr:longitudinals lacking protein-like [Macrosteles quadrilineatus]